MEWKNGQAKGLCGLAKRADRRSPLTSNLSSPHAMDTALEELILSLQQAGRSKSESIKELATQHGMGLAAAKRAVHGSAAWAYRRASDEEFHARLIEHLEADVEDK